jgi:hypothetical protein
LTIGSTGYQSALSGCEQWAQPSAGPESYRGPHFDGTGGLIVQYDPNACRDVGLTQETYAPGTGLVRRSITTIRGELTFDLIYARVNGTPLIVKSGELVLTYDFNHGSKGWLAGFSDYTLRTSDLRMLAELRPLADEVSRTKSGFYIQSMNRSDDLFMFLKKHLSTDDGLEPYRDYRLSFDIRFSSNAPTGCFGVGGSPGDSVYLKAGASVDEPVTLLTSFGDIHVSVDKGQQAVGGREAGVAGTIANGAICEGTSWPYVSVRRKYAHAQPLRTDVRGSLWLIMGTDSAYEGLTGLYVESITVRVNPMAEAAGRSGRRPLPKSHNSAP